MTLKKHDKTTILYKHFQFKKDDVKESDDGFIIKAYGAVKNVADAVRDVIKDGAFKKTLEERKGRIAFCLNHCIYNPIGKILEIKEDDYGLYLEVLISKSEQDIITKIKEGIYKELSIGYSVIDCKRGEFDGEEVLFLTELKLYEVSLVTLACNEFAVIIDAKGELSPGATDTVMEEMERLILNEKNHSKKYELMQFKTLLSSYVHSAGKQKQKPTTEPTIEDVKLEDVSFTNLLT